MRRLWFLALLAAAALPLYAAKRVTVVQLEQSLTTASGSHKPDAEIAGQIRGFELHLNGMLASENAMSELADGTGGTFFHNSNDLEGGLKSLAAAPEYVYMLGISLKDVKANGTFHQLQIKVNGHGLDVRARRGYFAPKATGSNR
jgi:VWFA-related protein